MAKWPEEKCYSSSRSVRQGCVTLPLPACTAPSSSGSGLVGCVEGAAGSSKLTHACPSGLPVACSQRKGRPLDGGKKARDDRRPAVLVPFELSPVSFDPLGKRRNFPKEGYEENIIGVFPCIRRITKFWKLCSTKEKKKKKKQLLKSIFLGERLAAWSRPRALRSQEAPGGVAAPTPARPATPGGSRASAAASGAFASSNTLKCNSTRKDW